MNHILLATQRAALLGEKSPPGDFSLEQQPTSDEAVTKELAHGEFSGYQMNSKPKHILLSPDLSTTRLAFSVTLDEMP